MSRSSIITFLLLLCFFSSSGQDKYLKFGEVDKESLQMMVYAPDSTAAAVVLGDKGYSTIKRHPTRGYTVHHTRHRRIKILSREGYDYADVSVLLYRNGGNKETILGLKGSTYNLENGKVKVSKLNRKAVFEEKYNKNFTFRKFTFPDVKVGSIIEYSYTLDSDFIFNLKEWSFQDKIPTVWSQYKVAVSEVFTYEKFAQGFHTMSINTHERKAPKKKYINPNRNSLNSSRTPSAGTDVFFWLAEDVPAFKEEPFMASTENYISKIVFELASTQFPDNPRKRYIGTWADLNKTFLEEEDFGKAINGSGFLRERVAKAISEATTDREKVDAIVDYIKSTVGWNGAKRRLLTSSLRDVVKSGKGSAADINLLLVNMLRKAGIQADPLLLSTRDNGFVRQQFALSSQFNYVIAVVDLDGQTLFLDATDKTLPPELIPQYCINGAGWRVSETKPGWVNVTSGGKVSSLFTANLELSENGTLTGKSSITYSDYAAREIRVTHAEEGEQFQSKLEGKRGWSIHKMELKGINDLSQRVVLDVEMETGHGVEMLGDMVYINPFVSEQMTENPFKLETRLFPIDFISPIRESYVLALQIPADFEVQELPKSEVVTLPSGAGKFAYYMQQDGNMIRFRCTTTINKSLFAGLEYPLLKEFFSKIVEKGAEQIVLKRKSEE